MRNPHMTSKSYLQTYQRDRGIGSWRSLYLRIMQHLAVDSVLEVGAGSPAFLAACSAPVRVAVDVADDNAEAFVANGIDFFTKNMDCDDLSDIGTFDVIVCSDVFEHLLSPHHAITKIRHSLNTDGLLFSHVPNEFIFKKIIKIMFGTKTSVNFHSQELPDEWNDPHLRRFTQIGYVKMLQQQFKYNINIGYFRYSSLAKFIHNTRLNVPYTLQKGPTYISTNSKITMENINKIINENNKTLYIK